MRSRRYFTEAAFLAAALAACDPSDTPAPPAPPAPSVPGPPLQPEPEPDPFKHVIGSYSTEYRFDGKEAARASNVVLAARRLDGKVLDPGAELSFNDEVGVRSERAGFVKAPTIFLGELLPDVGGGVCQVSSTLHAAALAAGLKVVRRIPHSRPAAYVMAGLDATVAYPPECGGDHRANDANGRNPACYSSDLVLRNIHPWPVRVSVSASDGRLEAAFHGREDLGRKVRFSSRFSWTGQYGRRMRLHPWKRSPDYRRKVQDGVRGRTAVLTVTVEEPGAEARKERYVSSYLPIDEVWEVGTGWDRGGPAPWTPDAGSGGAADAGQSGADRPPSALP